MELFLSLGGICLGCVIARSFINGDIVSGILGSVGIILLLVYNWFKANKNIEEEYKLRVKINELKMKLEKLGYYDLF